MILLYNPDCLHYFPDYGIEIPILNKRVTDVVDKFQNSKNFIHESFGPCLLEDIYRVHQALADKINHSPEALVLQTYELIDEFGRYNRYNPKLASKDLKELILKARLHVAGTYKAAQIALKEKACYFLGGGMHHAMSFRPGGFCMFNDMAIAIRKLQSESKIQKAIIIDLDCHKGDGTAEIFVGDSTVFTFSVHMKNGWPLDGKKFGENGKLNPSYISSDLDVEIPENSDDQYLSMLKASIEKVNLEEFDIAFVVHGVDVSELDVLSSSSKINLSLNQVLERDLYIYDLLSERNIAQTWIMGGGYGERISEHYIQFLEKCVF